MAIMGNNKKFENWANLITSIGFNFSSETTTPINRIKIHTNLKFKLLRDPFHPKQLLTTYAAARGAVIDDVIPDANSPIPKKYIA